MNGLSLPNTELNLYVIFDSIMTEQSITGAANEIGMTQPAVSNAVARMRQIWNDPLFVKQGRGVKPTPYAEQLWEKIQEPLFEIRQVTSQNTFDPSTATRVFRIGVTEHPVDMIWLPLRQHMENEAPGISLHSVPIHRNVEDLFQTASVDLAIHYYVGRHQHIRSSRLFNNTLVCTVRAGHPLLEHMSGENVLDLDAYLSADHLMVSLSGEARANVDQILAEQGVQRKIAMTVNHFSLIPSILKGSDLVCVTPQSVVAPSVRAGELVILPLPFEIDPAPISLLWHTRQNRDPGNLWLRNLITKYANSEVLKRVARLEKI